MKRKTANILFPPAKTADEKTVYNISNMAKKFYAAKGEENRIFETWDECKAFLEGRKGYRYKSFSTREEANAFLAGEDYYSDRVSQDVREGYAVAFTDGSFEESVGAYSYGVVGIAPDGKEILLSGRGDDPSFLPTRNVAGEVLGVLAALRWAYLNGYPKLIVYHDYEGLAAWAEKRWKATGSVSSFYLGELKKFTGYIDITFRKVKGHSNHFFNDKVDALAKEALFEKRCWFPGGLGAFTAPGGGYSFLCNEIHRQAPKACYGELYDGVSFSYREERIGIFPREKGLLVSGAKGKLFAAAVLSATETADDGERARIFGEAYGIGIPSDRRVSGTEICRRIEEKRDEKTSGDAILFALADLAAYVKRSLKENGISYDRISSVFKDNNGNFELIYDSVSAKEKKKIERAYNLFYRWRMAYFGESAGGEETAKRLSLIEEALQE